MARRETNTFKSTQACRKTRSKPDLYGRRPSMMLKDDYAKALSYRQYVQIQTQRQTRAQMSHHSARYVVILPPANKQREPDYRFLSGCGGRKVNARSDMGHAKTSRPAISLSPIKFDQFSNLAASLPTTHGGNVQDRYYKRLRSVQDRHVRVASVKNPASIRSSHPQT